MAHVGQEGAARRGGLLGPVFGGTQFLLHGPALGDVGGELDHLQRLALRIKNGAVGGLDPYLAPGLAQTQVLAPFQLTALQLLPELLIGFGLGVSGVTEDAVVLPDDFFEPVAHQLQEVGVGVQHMAVQVKLDHRQGAVNRAHGAFKLGIALLEECHVHDDTINPQHLAVVSQHRAATFRYPVRVALLVHQAELHVVRALLLDGGRHLVPQARHVFRHRQLAEVDTALQKILGLPAGECHHGIADEQHGPVCFVTAAKRDPWCVGHERAKLFLVALEFLLHRAALAQVTDEAHEQGIAIHLHPAHRQADGHRAAVTPQGVHLAAAGADKTHPLAVQITLQVPIVAGPVGLGHEHGHVLPQHLTRPPAQNALGRGVVRLHPATGVNHHNAIHGCVGNRPQARFALAHLEEHVPVAQACVDGHHQQPDADHHRRNRQRHGRALV